MLKDDKNNYATTDTNNPALSDTKAAKNEDAKHAKTHDTENANFSDPAKLFKEISFSISAAQDIKTLENVKVKFIGKSGVITNLLKNLKNLNESEKKTSGAKINEIKNFFDKNYKEKLLQLEEIELNNKLNSEYIDVTLPVVNESSGTIHPITKVVDEVAQIFASYGFKCEEGPDIESEYFNFTALNIPEHHPARGMHDTFYIDHPKIGNHQYILRTHTSPVQIHTMLSTKPPFRMFSVGRVYRNDYDATHTPMFSQFEGLVINETVNFSHLKWLMSNFLKKFFNVEKINLRFRPSCFPFTEPSAEVDINYDIKNGKIIFGTGEKWLEIAGCGMVHPNVLNYGNIDTGKFQGVAFAFGIERLTSLKYGIPDLRGYFESNSSWRNVFGFSYTA